MRRPGSTTGRHGMAWARPTSVGEGTDWPKRQLTCCLSACLSSSAAAWHSRFRPRPTSMGRSTDQPDRLPSSHPRGGLPSITTDCLGLSLPDPDQPTSTDHHGSSRPDPDHFHRQMHLLARLATLKPPALAPARVALRLSLSQPRPTTSDRGSDRTDKLPSSHLPARIPGSTAAWLGLAQRRPTSSCRDSNRPLHLPSS